MVALKKCFDAFRNATDAQRTFREIMYLQVSVSLTWIKVLENPNIIIIIIISLSKQSLSGHENIIRLQHVIKAENDRDIYLTFDHMETGEKPTLVKSFTSLYVNLIILYRRLTCGHSRGNSC